MIDSRPYRKYGISERVWLAVLELLDNQRESFAFDNGDIAEGILDIVFLSGDPPAVEDGVSRALRKATRP